MTRFVHDLPFGAQPLDPHADRGPVRFRLWAPAQSAPTLALRDGTDVAMTAVGDGWFEATVPDLPRAARYGFLLDDGMRVPDPASRLQDGDVHGWSVVGAPTSYDWRAAWNGRPWDEAVLYELHVGTFTPDGTYAGAAKKLDHLAETGVTAIELMPVADFPGTRGWGYDGVLHFAPEAGYGTPDELKALIDAAHARGLMVFLDVVYNHFGPDGNYLHLYAPQFFDEDRHTPWGAGIDYTRPQVRDFFVHNALYWLREFRFDGLRFDAVDWIKSPPDFADGDEVEYLKDLARRIREGVAAEEPERLVHLVLENDDNNADLLARDGHGNPVYFTAQWNDDWHHAAHTLLTGEADGYYRDYADAPAQRLARGLASGFVYQGEASAHREGALRGMPSAHLPPGAFVDFLQNHDQIGNRAFGDRLTELAEPEALEAATAALLLAPQVPLLYMGEEWGETARFYFFCDFHDELAEAVRKGRRNEFRKFARFADAKVRQEIPDPNARETFAASQLDWSKRDAPDHRRRLDLVQRLLKLRQDRIAPILQEIGPNAGETLGAGGGFLQVRWHLSGGGTLDIALNVGDAVHELAAPLEGATLFHGPCQDAPDRVGLAARCAHVALARA